MDERALSGLSVIIPNLHLRYTGVTATNRMVAPRIGRLCGTAWFGNDAPDGIERLTCFDLLRLRFGAQRRKPRVWHARRNDEMVAGVLLRNLGWPLKLVFTSEAQRYHTWISRYLIK